MSLEDLKADEVANAFGDIIRPVDFVNSRVRSKDTSPAQLIKHYWFISAALILLCDGIIIHFSGFNFDEKAFLLISVVLMKLLSTFIFPFGVFLLMRFAGCKVPWLFVMIIFTPSVLFSPIEHLVNYSFVLQRYELMNFFYHKSFSLDAALTYSVENKRIFDLIYAKPYAILSLLSALVSGIEYYLLIVACEALVLFSKKARMSVYVLVALAGTITNLPAVSLQNLEYVLIASYAPSSSIKKELEEIKVP